MTRIATYLTERADDVNLHVRMGRAMVLMMGMIIRGFAVGKFKGHEDVNVQMDYALESPDLIPAGACEQHEIDCGETAAGIPEYCVSASQMAIRRDDE